MAKSFDPWRFGSVAIPPELRREIIATELPVIPSERLYVDGASARVVDATKPRLVGLAVGLVACGAVAAGWWLWS